MPTDFAARFQPLFADVSGTPTPVLPFDADGVERRPDGATVFTLEQASHRFGRPQSVLRRQWEATWGPVLPPPDAPAVAPEGTPPPSIAADKLDRLHQAMYPHLDDYEWQAFIDICHARRLNPWTRKLWPVVHVNEKGVRELQIITTIEALREIAHRTGDYLGIAYQQWCGPELDWRDLWTREGPPYAARVAVLRRGAERPFPGVALWREHVRMYRNADNVFVVDPFWQRYATRQLAKCAHALSLREAFPECDGLYIDTEISRGRRPTTSPACAGAAIEDDQVPQGWQGFNNFLVDWGLQNSERRKAAIEKLRLEMPGVLESNPERFYREAVHRLTREPQKYGAVAPHAAA